MKTPFDHKAIGDLNFCRGINLFVFHRYAMQPWLDRFPGMTMGPWGTNFERTNTWWEQSRAWMKYLARCEYLLQEGLFVADACYYYGEGAPNTIVAERSALSPALPAGYDFDCCDTTVLLNRLSVKDGRIVLPDGMSYRVLVLPEGHRLTPRVLQKVRELVEAGATVVGSRPEMAPTLKDYPRCDEAIKSLADALWADCDGKTILEHKLGKGKIAAVYIGLGSNYQKRKAPVMREFLSGLVKELLPEPLLTVTGSHLVNVTLNKLGDSYAINLVNMAGEHADKNVFAYDELPAIGPLEIVLQLAKKPKEVMLQPEHVAVNYNYNNGKLRVVIPALAIHSIITIKP